MMMADGCQVSRPCLTEGSCVLVDYGGSLNPELEDDDGPGKRSAHRVGACENQ